MQTYVFKLNIKKIQTKYKNINWTINPNSFCVKILTLEKKCLEIMVIVELLSYG